MWYSSGTSQYVGYKNRSRKRIPRKKLYFEECQICNNWEQKRAKDQFTMNVLCFLASHWFCGNFWPTFLKMNYTPLYTALCLWCLSSPKRTLTLVRRQVQRNIWGQWGFVLTYFNPIVIRIDRLRPSHRLVPLDFKIFHWALEERTLRIGTAKISWLCSTCWLWLMMMTYFRPLETWHTA